jgi:CheY-like chemotaxis protein
MRILTDPHIGCVKADPGQIEQVIMNLVVNARDAMPNGGHLSIHTANVDLDEEFALENNGAKPGQYVMLAVSDDGCGMSVADQSHLFEPFFTTKELGKGTGLGLSTVYGIVKQSEGYIKVQSREGLGSVFAIYLPRVQGEAIPGKNKLTSAARQNAAETILLVEDEGALLGLVRNLLRMQGYRVLSAKDATSAIQICREHAAPIHLLVTDAITPATRGRDLARQVLAMHPGTKVLFMSGHSEDAICHQGSPEPNTAFLQKPFTISSLTDKVRDVMGAAMLRDVCE